MRRRSYDCNVDIDRKGGATDHMRKVSLPYKQYEKYVRKSQNYPNLIARHNCAKIMPLINVKRRNYSKIKMHGNERAQNRSLCENQMQ